MKARGSGFLLTLLLALAAACPLSAAETLDQLIAGAKKEPEMTFIAGASALMSIGSAASATPDQTHFAVLRRRDRCLGDATITRLLAIVFCFPH